MLCSEAIDEEPSVLALLVVQCSGSLHTQHCCLQVGQRHDALQQAQAGAAW